MTKFRRLISQRYGAPLSGPEFGLLVACVAFAVSAMLFVAAFVAAILD